MIIKYHIAYKVKERLTFIKLRNVIIDHRHQAEPACRLRATAGEAHLCSRHRVLTPSRGDGRCYFCLSAVFKKEFLKHILHIPRQSMNTPYFYPHFTSLDYSYTANFLPFLRIISDLDADGPQLMTARLMIF